MKNEDSSNGFWGSAFTFGQKSEHGAVVQRNPHFKSAQERQ